MCTGISRQITTASSGVWVNVRKVNMLRIKVFQNGSTRIYITNSYDKKDNKSEAFNFMYEMVEVDKDIRKTISFEDAITKAWVFISPVACSIEIERVADE